MTVRLFPFKLAALVALVASVGVHFGVTALDPELLNEVQIAGGQTAQTAALGSSFENLVRAGDRLSPVENEMAATEQPQPGQITPTTTPAAEPPPSAEPMEPVETQALASSAPPVPAETPAIANAQAPPVPVDSARTPQTEATQPRAADTVTQSQHTDVPAASTPALVLRTQNPAIAAIMPTRPTATEPVVAPAARAQGDMAPSPLTAADQPETAALRPVSPQDVIEAAPDQPFLPIPATRPFRQIDVDRARAREQAEAERQAERQRQAEQQRRAEKQRAERQQQVRQQPSPSGQQQGQANRNAVQGRADGNRQSEGATARDGNQRTSQAGNAAASNYPGKVYAKIRRTRQRAAGGRGTVSVQFSIAGSGALAGVSVAASSGSQAVDRAAMNHIQRAAPFPAPPPGAQTRFVIPIEIRR